MRLLLDSHALIWAVEDPSKLGARAFAELRNKSNEIAVSAASIWEISIKHGVGKLTLSLPFRPWIEQALADLEAELLPITVEHAAAQAKFRYLHRDPFDRMLLAQSQVERLPLVSCDPIFAQYQAELIW